MADYRLNIKPAVRQHFYTSPQTPSTTLKSKPIMATSFDSPHYSSQRPVASRKRSRNDSWDYEASESPAPSPAPLTNMNYRLAGGLQTPSTTTTQYSAYDASTPETSFRGGRSYISSQQGDYFHSYGGETIRGMPGRDGNGRAPIQASSAGRSSWGSLVFDIAGKVLDFCTAGSFRGFFSGGGQGYALRGPGSTVLHRPEARSSDTNDWLDFPTASSGEPDHEDARVLKKSKTSHDDSWVMVKTPESPALRERQSFIPSPTTPTRTSSNASAPAKPSSNASVVTIGRPQLTKRPTANLRRTLSTRTASSAGLRSPEQSHKQQQSYRSKHRRTASFRDAAADSNRRRDSNGISSATTSQTQVKAPLSACPASSYQGVQTHEQAESPLAKETRIHIDTIRKKEIAEDREIMKMNRQLKDLIRQGQEALGTRVEVDYDEGGDDW